MGAGRWQTWRVAAVGTLLLPVVGGLLLVAPAGPPAGPRGPGRPSDLPLPSRCAVAEYEERLFQFLNTREYVKLGWARDEGVRDTGPYLDGSYHGTHPAVTVYYSPGALRWLQGGRVGPVPDGEMIIKEQYPAPAARHAGKTPDQLWQALEGWTVMVKDAAGSHDGWFWSNPTKGQCVVDNHRYPFPHPVSGFGLYCVRCHAVTHSPGTAADSPANEFTFASLRNVAGFPGRPLTFPVDDSWRARPAAGKPDPAVPVDLQRRPHGRCVVPPTPAPPTRTPNRAFLRYFDGAGPIRRGQVRDLPPATHDWVVRTRDAGQAFVTSNQCMTCHAGLVAPFGPSMFVPTGRDAEYGAAGWDVSPYGEWRWTPMGLAGRDPVFHAQVESELRLLRDEFRADPARAGELSTALTDTCLRCHGAMGHHEFHRDHPTAGATFSLAHVHAVPGPKDPPGHGDAKYGALARDGVSCAVCHRMQPRPQPAGDRRSDLQFYLETSTTGNLHLGPPGEIYGPFRDAEIAPYAMEHGIGLKPKHSPYLQSSRLCGTCHTVVLPAVDRPLDTPGAGHGTEDLARAQANPLFRKFQHHVEQSTYLEWLNSEYENEADPQNPKGRSCQDCHMSKGLRDPKHGIDVPQIQTRIAAIQDTTYPDAENLAAPDRLTVRRRDAGYRRHNFSGLNVFLLELFRQGNDILGVPKDDFMTGSTQGIEHAIESMVQTARTEVAEVKVDAVREGPRRLTARVVVTNKVGHRFPSGVGFRRAFLELAVVQPAEEKAGKERVVWASGRTNELGVLLGADGQPLPTESFARDPKTGRQQYQPHHEEITSPDQVQVYETLLKDAGGAFTTSFVHGCEIVKDNRLLPRGWKRAGPGAGLSESFRKATHPDAKTLADPRYADGSGTDAVTYRIDLPPGVDPAGLRVRATLFYQALPPYYLRNLFATAPDGPATRRLHYLTSHLDLKGTPIEGWKLPITAAACDVAPRR